MKSLEIDKNSLISKKVIILKYQIKHRLHLIFKMNSAFELRYIWCIQHKN